jgi:three-Cys-motif partner protein
MQVEWSTIETLGRTRAVDLWYLVPTGIAYLRMMPRRKVPPPDWQASLDRAFGDGGWRRVYEQDITNDLFDGERVRVRRTGGVGPVEAYVMERLASAFHAVSPHIGQLSNSRNQIYSLVFCCGNPAAKVTAMRIANYILTQK